MGSPVSARIRPRHVSTPAGPRRARAAAALRLAAAACALLACASDPAEREYLEALRDEERGVGREQQIARLDRAIALAPDRARYLETRAVYRIDLRQPDRAELDLDRAIGLADRPYLRFLRGLVRAGRGSYAGAVADLDLAIAAEPDNAQFYRGRALARVELGDARGALADAERLVELAPRQAESHHARGRALVALGRYPEAIASFDAALRLRPELVYPLAARADALDRAGRPDGARADRELAARRALERASCAPCLDPFRY